MYDVELLTLCLLFAGALVAGFVSGYAGFGTGLIASGFWFLALPAASVPPLIVITSVTAQIIALVRLRQYFNWQMVAPYLAGGIAGVPAGVLTLHLASPTMLRITVGVCLVLYASVQLSRIRRLTIRTWGGKGSDVAVGTGAGFLGGFAGLPGPLPLIWLQLRGGSSAEQRGIYQPFNLIILILAGTGMLIAGRVDMVVVKASVICLPATILGTWFGLRLYTRTSENIFRNVVLSLLMISGSILLIQAISMN